MVNNVKAALHEMITSENWMDSVTTEKAIKKVHFLLQAPEF